MEEESRATCAGVSCLVNNGEREMCMKTFSDVEGN